MNASLSYPNSRTTNQQHIIEVAIRFWSEYLEQARSKTKAPDKGACFDTWSSENLTKPT